VASIWGAPRTAARSYERLVGCPYSGGKSAQGHSGNHLDRREFVVPWQKY